jgi:DNA mismatch repair protein MutS
VPKEVVSRAKKILAGLETGTFLSNPSKALSKETPEAEPAPAPQTPLDSSQMSFFGTGAKHPILEELKGLDVDGLTPRDALNILGEWKKKIEE